MPDIEFWCECGRGLRVKPEYVGRRTDCPECGNELIVPDFESARLAKAELPNELTPPATSVKALMSLVLGVLSFCLGFLVAIPAIVLGLLALRQIRRSKGQLAGKTPAVMGIGLACLGLLFTTVLIGGMAINVSRSASRRTACQGNLRQLGTALLAYEKRHGHFPSPAIADAKGQPLLSWRVALLEEIDPALHAQFRLDERWDSPHNRALLPRMPRIFACPTEAPGRSGVTRYLAVVGPGKPGPGAAFEEGRGVALAEFADGPANTILVAEADDPIPWTEPSELRYDPAPWLPPPNDDERDVSKEGPPPRFSRRHPRGVLVLLADGSVRFLETRRDRPSRIRDLLTRDGRENVGG